MAIGRTFKEALQKALRSLEIKRFGLIGDGADKEVDIDTLRLRLTTPNDLRIFYVAQAFDRGASIDEVFELTKIDRFFLQNIRELVLKAREIPQNPGQKLVENVPAEQRAAVLSKYMRGIKKLGFSDRQLAHLYQTPTEHIRE